MLVIVSTVSTGTEHQPVPGVRPPIDPQSLSVSGVGVGVGVNVRVGVSVRCHQCQCRCRCRCQVSGVIISVSVGVGVGVGVIMTGPVRRWQTGVIACYHFMTP